MVVYSFAVYTARKCYGELVAVDRYGIKNRTEKASNVINFVLNYYLRRKIYGERYCEEILKTDSEK